MQNHSPEQPDSADIGKTKLDDLLYSVETKLINLYAEELKLQNLIGYDSKATDPLPQFSLEKVQEELTKRIPNLSLIELENSKNWLSGFNQHTIKGLIEAKGKILLQNHAAKTSAEIVAEETAIDQMQEKSDKIDEILRTIQLELVIHEDVETAKGATISKILRVKPKK